MRILLTGDYDRDEFAGAVADMSRAADVVRFGCLDAAAQKKAIGEPVDLIVVAQARPGQFSPVEIDALRRAAPLAPLVALLGSWCEGEMRSGSPWPGVTRVYWHQWRERFQAELASFSHGKPSGWTLPPTVTAEERLLTAFLTRSVRATVRSAAVAQVVAIVSDELEIGGWLASACDKRGLSAIQLRRPPGGPIEGVELVLWDIGLSMPTAVEAFQLGVLRFPGAAAIVLADFPRPDDVGLLMAAGAAAVLSKPLLADDLYACFDRLLAE